MSLSGQRNAYVLYSLIIILAFAAIVSGLWLGYLGKAAIFSFISIFMSLNAAQILKKHYNNKLFLVLSSELTINLQALVGIILIIGLFI